MRIVLQRVRVDFGVRKPEAKASLKQIMSALGDWQSVGNVARMLGVPRNRRLYQQMHYLSRHARVETRVRPDGYGRGTWLEYRRIS